MEAEDISRVRCRILEVITVCGGRFKASRLTEVEREEIVRIYRGSGITAAMFAEAIGLSTNQFRNFQNKPKQKKTISLVPVKVAPNPRSEIRYEVISPRGYRVIAGSLRGAAELLRAIEDWR